MNNNYIMIILYLILTFENFNEYNFKNSLKD